MNGSFRALLIGVPEYRDKAIPDLPFVTDDMAELAGALTSAGYDVAVHEPGETDRESIDAAIEGFFQSAAEGDTLLLCLSGHGVHHGDVDYLVPKGARTSAHDFPGKCLSLDFGPYVERSLAGDVVVFVDACREGITLKEMSVTNAHRWSETDVKRIGERHYGYVYACSKGESAQFFADEGAAFSFFSRALSAVVADEGGPRTLAELSGPLQRELDRLTVAHRAAPQRIRIRTETGLDDFVLFERPDRGSTGPDGVHPWVRLAREHPAWTLAGGGQGAEAMSGTAAVLVAGLAREADRDGRALSEDPWFRTDLAERMTVRLGWLLSKVLGRDKPALSPAEALLLVVVPFLYVACANRAAVRALPVVPGDLAPAANPSEPRSAYEQFAVGRSRQVRRAAQAVRDGDRAGAAGIGWWVFRQWLAHKPGGHYEEILDELCGPVDRLTEGVETEVDRRLVHELFGLDTLTTLLRSLRTAYDPSAVRPVRQLVGSTTAEQQLREQLLIALLAVAHHLAIDPLRLPDVVVDHLGIRLDAVDLAELHLTVQGAGWEERGRTRVLSAACHHPAVGLALREQAAALDALLRTIDTQAADDPQLAPLQLLPTHATADRVRAAVDARNRPVYEATDLRFRLADDRIQELLMGEQLYGDPALAIRELYQNALDACRYRDARTRYLRKQRPNLRKWSGRIGFVQGVDEDGRAYIECRDNGIGMGTRELREVFSHAGVRFAELPEFIDEQAAWRAEGIDFHPNSRFGIGVLSYFMIADDIRVTTCRLDREGHPGNRLEVHIAGPGSLFRIRDLGRDYDAGTIVRLYLRNPDTAPSCTDLLRRLLWRSQYTVTAQDGETDLHWKPDELSPVAPLGAQDPYRREAERVPKVRVDATDRPDVWWVGSGGGVLADGLWVGLPLFGVVVDLSGKKTPRLTVDRRETLSYDTGWVSELLHRQIPALLRPGAEVLDHGWLSELVRHLPGLADAVAAEAAARSFALGSSRGPSGDSAVVGCFPSDADLVRTDASGLPAFRTPRTIPAYVVEWRALAWAAAGTFADVAVTGDGPAVLARPSDHYLLNQAARAPRGRVTPGDDTDPRDRWLERDVPVPAGHVLDVAAWLGRPTSAVLARLAEFGLRGAAGAALPEEADPDDLLILSERLDRTWPWLKHSGPVSVQHVLRCAGRLGWAPAAVVERLAGFGFTLGDGVVVPETVETADLVLVSRDLDAVAPWLTAATGVTPGHVLKAAELLGRSPTAVVTRLSELGFPLSEGVVLPEAVEPEDLIIWTEDGSWRAPDLGGQLWLGHALMVAGWLGWAPAAVVERLAGFGLTLPDGAVVPEAVQADDLVLVSRDLDGLGPWLSYSVAVSIGHVLAAAERLGWSPPAVAARLTELGLTLPDGAVVPDCVEPEDLILLSSGLNFAGPWLDPLEPLQLKHVMDAALRLRREPRSVAARLADLGHRLPAGVTVPASADPLSLSVLDEEIGQRVGRPTSGGVVSHGQVLRAAHRAKCSPAVVQARLKELGFSLELEVDGALPETVTAEDVEMIRPDPQSSARWLDPRVPVGLAHVLQASGGKTSPAVVAARLEALGFTLATGVRYTRPDGAREGRRPDEPARSEQVL
ncbi:caspase family protein [Kitasatospora sp. NPDC057965]|uniref:wHTH domain-containing protein n=1 Tax=Kitasatospora sp. NPDC057965 TaxID=3346291 RepID=UPI0036D8AFC8